MKSLRGNIFEQITSVDNIVAAIHSAAKGKRKKRAVKFAEAHDLEVARRLHDELVAGTWTPPAFHVGREINDGLKAKKRVIVCPEFVREQVVHHALLNILAPYIQRRSYRWSCGSMPGRGQEEMAKYISKKVAGKKLYVVPNLDVAKCFDSVDVDAIYAKFEKCIGCRRTLALIRRILDGNRVRMSDGAMRKGGLPIGLFTSPWFMNFILEDVDHCFKDEFGVAAEMRFMDDIPIFDTNKRRLRRAVEAATDALARYGLKWKRPPQIHKFDHKVRICGFCVHPDGRVELRDRVYLNGRRLGGRLVAKRKAGHKLTAYDAQKMTSYSARFKAFGCWRAFAVEVLRGGKLTMSGMASIISRHDRAKAKARKSA
jgi:hypothetical protein